MYSGIYILKNKINNKYYIGQSINLYNRIKSHKNNSNNKNGIIDNAINKYGWDNFEIFKFYLPEYLLDIIEIGLIYSLNTLSPNGYNLESGGNNNKHHHLKSRIKMSASAKGGRPWNKGKYGIYKLSEETKRKISESTSNAIKKLWANNQEYIKRHRLAKMGINNPMYGKTGSLHHNFGKKQSEEAKRKNSESTKKYYKEHLGAGKRHSKIMKKYYENPENREKMSKRMLQYYENKRSTINPE